MRVPAIIDLHGDPSNGNVPPGPHVQARTANTPWECTAGAGDPYISQAYFNSVYSLMTSSHPRNQARGIPVLDDSDRDLSRYFRGNFL